MSFFLILYKGPSKFNERAFYDKKINRWSFNITDVYVARLPGEPVGRVAVERVVQGRVAPEHVESEHVVLSAADYVVPEHVGQSAVGYVGLLPANAAVELWPGCFDAPPGYVQFALWLWPGCFDVPVGYVQFAPWL